MGGNAKPFETKKEVDKQLTHKRVLWLAGLVVAFCGICGGAFGSLSFSFGVIIGGFLSFLNYYWMKVSLKKAFDHSLKGQKPRIYGIYFILRYLAFGLVLALIYLTNLVPIAGVILGLSSFAFAVVIEGILRIFSLFSSEKEI